MAVIWKKKTELVISSQGGKNTDVDQEMYERVLEGW